MRFFNKYKICTRYVDNFPARILKFKHTKWKKIQKRFNIKKKFLSFKNIKNSVYKIKNLVWKKYKLAYKNNLKIKYKLKSRYDWLLKISKLKLKKNKIIILNNTLLKTEYQLDVLLWKLGFFKNSYQARQFIYNGLISINTKIVYSKQKNLKSGDIIEIKNFQTNLNFSDLKEIKNSFLEMDYYTSTVIVLKPLKNLSRKDLTCNVKDNISEYEINNLILKK